MATERDLELLDDYLSNRLEGTDKADFERKLESDASLQNELAVQKELVEGLKQARIAELKSMLSQTVIPPPSASSVAGKIAAWVIAASIVGAGSYYLLREKDNAETASEPAGVTERSDAADNTVAKGNSEIEKAEPEVGRVEEKSLATEESNKETVEKKAEADQSVKAPETKTAPQKSAPVIQPELTPYDPTKEPESTTDKPELSDELGVAGHTGSSIVVEVDGSNKKYDFHYRFADGKLYLLGSFEKDLYEIMEFFNNKKRTVFLYYHSNFYLLDESQEKPTPLTAITDPQLLQKLRDYRGN